jgi:hypothetical protein
MRRSDKKAYETKNGLPARAGPFPAALDDAVTAYRPRVANGANPGRMAVLGESSGGATGTWRALCLWSEWTHSFRQR